MKKIYQKGLALLLFVATLTGVSCQKAEYRDRYEANEISDFYATYEGKGRERLFTSRIENDTIFLHVDYYYPIDTDDEVDLTRMLVRATIPSDATVSPEMGEFWDLSADRQVTVTSGSGESKTYVLRTTKAGNTDVAQAELTFEDQNGEEQKLQAILQGNDINFSVVPGTVISNARLSYTINRHSFASIADGGTINLDNNVNFVVSSVGNARRNFTIQTIEATKLAKGIRPGSARIMFEKRLNADLGITTVNMTGGIAAAGDYLVINTRNENSVYLNALTGERLGQIELGPIRGGLRNFYTTADRNGNIFISNLTPNDGSVFNIWKLSSVSSTPESFIQWDAGAMALGRKFSVQGSVDGNAIITVPVVGVLSSRFLRWQVVGGNLVSQTPEIITISGYSWDNNNADIVYTSETNLASDYYVVGYRGNRLARVNGATNSVVSMLAELNNNFISNAVDYIEFNNGKYVTYNFVNGQPWGTADYAFLIDTEGGFTGDPTALAGMSGLVWRSVSGKYGWQTGGIQNGNGTGDVAMRISDNGYYLYLYFMFTNGYVVGVQFDCVDI